MVGQFRQTWIRRSLDPIERGGKGRDQDRIQHIVLGTPQVRPTVCLDLHRLQHQDREVRCTQMIHHAALVAAGRLDADATDTGLDQFDC